MNNNTTFSSYKIDSNKYIHCVVLPERRSDDDPPSNITSARNVQPQRNNNQANMQPADSIMSALTSMLAGGAGENGPDLVQLCTSFSIF